MEQEDLLSAEQQSLAATLTTPELDGMDAALLSHARPQPRKLAMIVALAMEIAMLLYRMWRMRFMRNESHDLSRSAIY